VKLQLKIPVAVYQPTLSKLARLGTQMELSEQARDVTQQVADVNSLVTSAQDAITQLQALLKRAGSVADLLSVQDQINQQESSLEALQAQQRALAGETSYATVSVTLVGPQPAHHTVKKAARQHGFLAGLTSGWHGLRIAVSGVLTAIGALLPFAVVAAVLAGAGYAGRRRLRRLLRRRTRPTPAP
jgi:small-conductance mechanosensitive channel